MKSDCIIDKHPCHRWNVNNSLKKMNYYLTSIQIKHKMWRHHSIPMKTIPQWKLNGILSSHQMKSTGKSKSDLYSKCIIAFQSEHSKDETSLQLKSNVQSELCMWFSSWRRILPALSLGKLFAPKYCLSKYFL